LHNELAAKVNCAFEQQYLFISVLHTHLDIFLEIIGPDLGGAKAIYLRGEI
jgi:hypothetical protein